jgi:serine phosphatase RsbU (regulator of sigma subunit)
MVASGCTALDYGIAARALPGERESGDLHAVIPLQHGLLVAVADGLGHGYEAPLAARVAVNTLARQPHLSVLSLVNSCHATLSGTRGVALSIASLEWHAGTMTWLSVGNVAGLLLHTDEGGHVQREHVPQRGGIVGHRLPPLRAATVPLHRGDVLIFVTDGVREAFVNEISIDAPPQETADCILARYGKQTDDALVLVGRWLGPPVSGPPTGR